MPAPRRSRGHGAGADDPADHHHRRARLDPRVPPSIRDAALGVGASKLQASFHHVLPLAMPGILTGTIIGMAQALGETAPLIMIGMVAFIVDIPHGHHRQRHVLPVQIFRWSDFPERPFEHGRRAICVLLAFLVLMNACRLSCANVSSGAGRDRMRYDGNDGAHRGYSGDTDQVAENLGPRRAGLTMATTTPSRTSTVDISDKTVTAFIGPSGCGKSTFLRCINRMNDTLTSPGRRRHPDRRDDIYDPRRGPGAAARPVGMVFQKPNPFPKSIYDNVAYGPRIHGWPATRPNWTRSSRIASTARPSGMR